MRQHAGAAVRRVVRLEPAREGGMQARAARLRQAAVGDVAGERVLEDELGLRGADEPALHEGAHLGARAGQRGQACRSERAADHRGGLKRLLRLGREQVDAGGEDALNGVRDAEIDRGVAQRPAAGSPLEQPSVEEVREHFLDEERVSLRVAGDQLQCARLERAPASAASMSSVTSSSARRSRLSMSAPGNTARSGRMVASTRTGPSASESTRSSTSTSGSAAQCRSSMTSTAGLPRAELRDQLHPLVLQLQQRGPRVEIAGDVETEREAEDLAAGEPLQRVLGRVLLAQAELLSQHVGERAVGHAAAVGEAATEPKRGPGRQPLPELADEARLAHARLTHDRGEPRAAFRLRAREHVLEPLELAPATHEPCFQAVAAAWPPRRAHPPELPADDAAFLPFRLDRPRLAELERAADEGRGALPHE